MKLDFEGRTWQLDTGDMSMTQAETITTYTGTSISGWEKAVFDPESPLWLKAMRGLYWLMLAQNSEPVPLEQADFAVLRFYTAYAAAASAEVSEVSEAEADPTKPGALPAGEPPPASADSLTG